MGTLIRRRRRQLYGWEIIACSIEGFNRLSKHERDESMRCECGSASSIITRDDPTIEIDRDMNQKSHS